MESPVPIAEDPLVPPAEMLYDGSSSPGQFVQFGDSFSEHVLIPRVRLAPSDAVLDLGCGNGAVARALTRYLSREGRYEGLDVSLDSVTWLRDRYRGFPNFRFTHADVYNKMYNPGGQHTGEAYPLPFPASTFSVVLLKSVFTHMLPSDVRSYLSEVSRVLRPGGRALITYFLLNPESRAFVDRGLDHLSIRLRHDDDDLCRVASLEVPEQAIAHDEQRIRSFYQSAGLSVADLSFGNWCGRPSLLGLQDLVVAIKE